MKKHLVSIVVPVYNVEKYLKRCVDSIINQSYNNIEILLVDDGSTDSSGKICDDYLKKDSRIKVIHKQNGGLSDARNFGIDKSTGDYLSFIDSDDWIEKDMIMNLFNSIINEKSDISIEFMIIKKKMLNHFKLFQNLVLLTILMVLII